MIESRILNISIEIEINWKWKIVHILMKIIFYKAFSSENHDWSSLVWFQDNRWSKCHHMLFQQLYFSLEIEVALRRNIFSQFLWQFLWHGNFPNLLTSTLTYSIFLVECSFIIPYFIFTGHVCFMYSRNYRFNWHPKQIWGYLQKREGKKVKIAVMYILEMLQI